MGMAHEFHTTNVVEQLAEKHFLVYRCWACDHACLYVSMTIQPLIVRMAAHRSKKWWPLVVSVDYTEVQSFEEAQVLEFQEANEQQALYNIALRPQRSAPKKLTFAERRKYWDAQRQDGL
jgi:hypothetical protein